MGTRYGFVSTYLPARGAVPAFTAGLRGAITEAAVDEARVVALVDAPLPRPAHGVSAQWVRGDSVSLAGAVEQLEECDIVIVQHEFASYGGDDGSDVLLLLDALTVPSVVVMHTVPARPTSHQRELIEAVAGRAAAVVTTTNAAHELLMHAYSLDVTKLSVVAHGAAEVGSTPRAPSALFRGASRTVLTWGLLGPGKGIEWGIEAMDRLRDLMPAPSYVIAGATHPEVAARDGEAYREGLSARIKRLGLGAAVRMDGRYLDPRALADLIAAADVVLLPYDATDTVSSTVLVEAVAAGKPVIATAFPHAVEVLAGGVGIVVAHDDPAAIADALRTVLTRPEVAVGMSRLAAATAPTLRWSSVAELYRALAARLIAASVAV
jgi:glycosyltransferase involved in cell wall biosynthesis